MRRAFLLLAVSQAISCGSPVSSPATGDATSAVTCDPGMRPIAPGGGGAAAGASACAPVGTTSIPEGFIPDGPWGFRANVPPAPCVGATMAVLGMAACQPIDDCAAPFPPKEATIAVRTGAMPYADRPDVTVVATFAEALAMAPSGGTIAIDQGNFDTPPELTKSVNVVGRCAEQASLVGPDFGVRIDSAINVSFTSVGFTGAPKAALLINSHAAVSLDRVYVHGANDGAEVGNGAALTVTRSVFEGPAMASNPNAATNGAHGIYGGHITLTGVELRGYQLSALAESVGTEVSLSKCVVHEERALAAEKEALSQLGAFLGAKLTIASSFIESEPGRIAMVGAARLDGVKDPTSPGDPPASLVISDSALLHQLVPREAGSVIDVVGGASLELDNVSLRHDSFIAIGASENSSVTIRASVFQTEPTSTNARMGFSGLSGAKLTLDSSALIGSAQFAILLDGASNASISKSLISGTREVGVADYGSFMGAAQALSVSPGGQATVNDSAFVANEGSAVFLQGATIELDLTVLAGTHASSFGPSTAAITGVDATVAIRSSALAKNDLALALRRGRTLLRDSSVTDHHEVMRLDGVTLVQTSAAVEDAVDTEIVAARTTFARNAVLVSSKSFTGE